MRRNGKISKAASQTKGAVALEAVFAAPLILLALWGAFYLAWRIYYRMKVDTIVYETMRFGITVRDLEEGELNLRGFSIVYPSTTNIDNYRGQASIHARLGLMVQKSILSSDTDPMPEATTYTKFENLSPSGQPPRRVLTVRTCLKLPAFYGESNDADCALKACIGTTLPSAVCAWADFNGDNQITAEDGVAGGRSSDSCFCSDMKSVSIADFSATPTP